MASCAIDSDEIGPDAAPAGDSISESERHGFWTDCRRPPYHAGRRRVSRRVIELKPDSPGDITVVAGLRWRDHAAGAVNPRVGFGFVTDRGESTLLQIFENDGLLRARVDLEMTDALEVGVWYRVVLTIADAPDRPVQVRIFDQDAVEVWRSCGDTQVSCPSAQIDAGDLENLRVNVTVDDVDQGEGQVEIRDISLQQDP